MAGLVVATFGLLPRWSRPIVWDALAAALVVSQLGEVLSLPVWVVNLSPFTHVPAVPAESAAVAPLLWLAAAAVALAGAGLAAFLRRDVRGAQERRTKPVQ
jgi:ABC-2 type transport system permease protein